MSSDDESSTDVSSGFIPGQLSDLAVLTGEDASLAQSPRNSALLLSEEVLGLVDFELLSCIPMEISLHAIHAGDSLPYTIDLRNSFLGSGASFDVWRFNSGRAKIELKYTKWIKKAQEAQPSYPCSDKFVIKRPTIGHDEESLGETDAGRLKSVLRELKALANPAILNHPNVVDLLGYVWDTQLTGGKLIAPAIILEDADLGSLDAFQKPYFFSLTLITKLEIVRDIGAGLVALHDADIVHGDVKAANVLLFTNVNNHKIQAKLSDFGFSVFGVDSETVDAKYRLVGWSPPWNAPESDKLLSGKGLFQTDIYSFGLLFWRILLDGHNPFSLISLCISGSQKIGESSSSIDGYCFHDLTSSTITPDGLSSSEILKLKIDRYDGLLRLARSSLKKRSQLVSGSIQSLGRAQDFGILGDILSECLCQDPVHRAPSMRVVLASLYDNPTTSMSGPTPAGTEATAHVGFKRHAMFTSEFPEYVDKLRYAPMGFRVLVTHLLHTIATETQPRSAFRARAALCLAICHLQGFHPKRNKQEALQFLIEAARGEDIIAQSYIKRVCQESISSDLPCIDWLRNASDHGLSVASIDLKNMDCEKRSPFRPYRIRSDAFPSFYINSEKHLLDSILPMIGAAQIENPITSNGETLLHYAAALGMCRAISILHLRGHKVIDKNKYGMAPLHLACWNGEISAIRLLLNLGSDVKLLASSCISPIHLAVASLSAGGVEILLNANCDIHVNSLSSLEEATGVQDSYFSDVSGTPLHWAVSRELVDIAKLLLARGANAAVKNSSGYSSITISARRHDAAMVQFLFNHGLETPLDADAEAHLSHQAALAAVRSHSLQPVLCIGRPSFDSLIAVLQILPFFDALDLLCVAMDLNLVEVAKYLIEKLKVAEKDTPPVSFTSVAPRPLPVDLSLNGLLNISVFNCSLSMAKLMLELGARPTGPCSHPYPQGGTLTFLSQSNTRGSSDGETVELAALLFDHGADVNATYPTGETALGLAVRYHQTALVEVFLRHRANPLAPNLMGITPYLSVLADGYSWTAIEKVKALIEPNPEILSKVFIRADHRTNFLNVLSRFGEFGRDQRASAKVCTILISNLKSLGNGPALLRYHLEQDDPISRFTPLHAAVSTGNRYIVDILLQEGADVNAKAMGQTPMSIAVGRLLKKTYYDMCRIDNQFSIRKGPMRDKRDVWSDGLLQCALEDGWIKYQERTNSIITLLEKHGGVESTQQDICSALSEQFHNMDEFFEKLGTGETESIDWIYEDREDPPDTLKLKSLWDLEETLAKMG